MEEISAKQFLDLRFSDHLQLFFNNIDAVLKEKKEELYDLTQKVIVCCLVVLNILSQLLPVLAFKQILQFAMQNELFNLGRTQLHECWNRSRLCSHHLSFVNQIAYI